MLILVWAAALAFGPASESWIMSVISMRTKYWPPLLVASVKLGALPVLGLVGVAAVRGADGAGLSRYIPPRATSWLCYRISRTQKHVRVAEVIYQKPTKVPLFQDSTPPRHANPPIGFHVIPCDSQTGSMGNIWRSLPCPPRIWSFTA